MLLYLMLILSNFVDNKISKVRIASVANITTSAFFPKTDTYLNDGQPSLLFNFEN